MCILLVSLVRFNIGTSRPIMPCISTIHSLSAPAPPATAENLMVTALASTSATVSWTVPMIAFTPETYSVKYGTERGNLESSSNPGVHSGTDFSAVNLPFSVTVTGLTPQTVYYYQLVTSNSIGNRASEIQSCEFIS